MLMMLDTSPFQKKLRINPPRFRSIYIPPATAPHSIGGIQCAGFVDEHWPGDICFAHILLGGRPGFEGDNNYVYAQRCQLVIMLTQLRQVFASGESLEVAVKHEQ